MSDEIDLLRPDEVASILRVGTSTVYREIQAGMLPAIRVGRILRITRKALNEYLVEVSTL